MGFLKEAAATQDGKALGAMGYLYLTGNGKYKDRELGERYLK